MQLAITNLSLTDELNLPYLEKVVKAGATIVLSVAQSELSKMVDLQQAVADGLAEYQVEPTAAEMASGILTAGLPPSALLADVPEATSAVHGLQTAQGKRIERQSYENCKYQLNSAAIAGFNPAATSAADWDGAVAGSGWTADTAAHVRLLNQSTGVIYTLTTETTCTATGETALFGALLSVPGSAGSPMYRQTAATGAGTEVFENAILFAKQAAWFCDSATGADRNPGTAPSPRKTLNSVFRSISDNPIAQATTITVVSDDTQDADLRAKLDGVGSLIIAGTPTAAAVAVQTSTVQTYTTYSIAGKTSARIKVTGIADLTAYFPYQLYFPASGAVAWLSKVNPTGSDAATADFDVPIDATGALCPPTNGDAVEFRQIPRLSSLKLDLQGKFLSFTGTVTLQHLRLDDIESRFRGRITMFGCEPFIHSFSSVSVSPGFSYRNWAAYGCRWIARAPAAAGELSYHSNLVGGFLNSCVFVGIDPDFVHVAQTDLQYCVFEGCGWWVLGLGNVIVDTFVNGCTDSVPASPGAAVVLDDNAAISTYGLSGARNTKAGVSVGYGSIIRRLSGTTQNLTGTSGDIMFRGLTNGSKILSWPTSTQSIAAGTVGGFSQLSGGTKNVTLPFGLEIPGGTPSADYAIWVSPYYNASTPANNGRLNVYPANNTTLTVASAKFSDGTAAASDDSYFWWGAHFPRLNFTIAWT